MQVVDVEFSWLEPEKTKDLDLPKYHSELASGMDVAAAIDEPVTLEPGDIICTGTPSGVGPMHGGDMVEVEIEKIGVLSNPVREE